MENLFLVVVLVGLGFGVWSLFLKKKKSVTPSTTSGGTWGGGGSTNDNGDGSVNPPSNGSNQV